MVGELLAVLLRKVKEAMQELPYRKSLVLTDLRRLLESPEEDEVRHTTDMLYYTILFYTVLTILYYTDCRYCCMYYVSG